MLVFWARNSFLTCMIPGRPVGYEDMARPYHIKAIQVLAFKHADFESQLWTYYSQYPGTWPRIRIMTVPCASDTYSQLCAQARREECQCYPLSCPQCLVHGNGLRNIGSLNEIKLLILCFGLAILKTRLEYQPSWTVRKKKDRSTSSLCSGHLQGQGQRPASVSSAPSRPPAPDPLQHLSQPVAWC